LRCLLNSSPMIKRFSMNLKDIKSNSWDHASTTSKTLITSLTCWISALNMTLQRGSPRLKPWSIRFLIVFARNKNVDW
jgi:hypothetical protein